jgi:DNA mismatch endonuclease, patch repair protein
MVDIVSPEKRSRMMSGIKGKNTKPELIVRKELFRRGFRYKLHDKKLPGKPDLVFPKCKAVVFIHGCFWHRHDCYLFKWPKSNRDFWLEKLTANAERDKKHCEQLEGKGWRVKVVWECALKNRSETDIGNEVDKVADWLLHNK